jgi:hypothetical protein
MGKVSDAFVMLEKCGLPQVHMQNITLSRVEYEILEALNGTTKANNQDSEETAAALRNAQIATYGSCGFWATYLFCLDMPKHPKMVQLTNHTTSNRAAELNFLERGGSGSPSSDVVYFAVLLPLTLAIFASTIVTGGDGALTSICASLSSSSSLEIKCCRGCQHGAGLLWRVDGLEAVSMGGTP